MKGKNHFIAAFLGMALAMQTTVGIFSDAVEYETDVITVPVGWTEETDSYFAQDSDVCTVYRKDEYGKTSFLLRQRFRYNYTMFYATNAETFLEIYQKYQDELDFDTVDVQESVDGSGMVYYTMCDYLDKNGNPSKNPEDFENKMELVQQLTAELKAADAVAKATFYRQYAAQVQFYYNETISVKHMAYNDESQEKLAEIVAPYDSDVQIIWQEEQESYRIDAVENYDTAILLLDVIQQSFENVTVSIGIDAPLSDVHVHSAEVDFLAGDNGLSGDINLDGKIDLADVILLNKAVSGSVVLTEEQRALADCNGDGSTSAEDAMTLLQFLVHLVDAL